jgi:hypothetical protein
MTQAAHVDHRGTQLIFLSYSRTPDGPWSFNEHFSCRPDDLSDEEIGTALLEALAFSTEEASPRPQGSQRPLEPVLRTIGVPTYDRYLRGLSAVSVKRDGTKIAITPLENLGAGRGLRILVEESLTLEEPDPASLGRAIRAKLK